MSSIAEWLDALGTWAWDRHHNILSWYVRPLFLLPFCYFAYKRSLTGIVLTLVALTTSMAWFPAPHRPAPAVVDMLRAERDYLLGEWTAAKVAIALLVPLVFAALALALWRRSIGWALVVINGAVLFKIAWTFFFGDTQGALAHLTPALAGLAAVNVAIVVAGRRLNRRRSAPALPERTA
ncbi:hypothetical protein [Nonomuraea sp. NPDC049709]|uniref:hypothetical protein n=1 Tax=Nonomuraea sp. NPDC049709 TaxID=3154736 RepID=UPI0034232E3C